MSLFGPVCSSRLGLSLGLDLLGDRICSFDCLYCESGKTRIRTLQRRPYVPSERILDELKIWMDNAPDQLDYITLGGPGEPCLNSNLGAIVQGIHKMSSQVPLAVLTNASLLGDPQVREELSASDVILPSMDSLIPEEFNRLNRPVSKLDPLQIAEEMLGFRTEFQGKIYLEILLVHGINDSRKNFDLLRQFCLQLEPDRVDVMTMSRPGAYLQKNRVSDRVLKQWREALGACTSHASGGGGALTKMPNHDPDLESMIVRSVQRRPQRSDQLARGLSLDLAQVETCLERLVHKGSLKALRIQDEVFYVS